MGINKNQYQQQQQSNKMDMEYTEEDLKWSPTAVEFQEYVARDYQLALSNVQGVLATRNEMSFRDLRDSLLHSSETTEEVLVDLIRAGNVKETRGRFTLVQHT